jgi:hypothetical protein
LLTPAFAGLVAFLCSFGGALGGMALRPRLPTHHFEAESKDAIRLSMATVATLTALVVGLLIASAKQSFDERSQELRNAAVDAVLLDRTLAAFGPVANGARLTLRDTIRDRLDRIEEAIEGRRTMAALNATAPGTGTVQGSLLALQPQNDDQRWLKAKALDISSDIVRTRWLLAEPGADQVQWPFLVIVMFWLGVTFASFGLFAPRNASVIVALFLTALSIAGSITVILEMDEPYGGVIRVSDAPMRLALDAMGQP